MDQWWWCKELRVGTLEAESVEVIEMIVLARFANKRVFRFSTCF